MIWHKKNALKFAVFAWMAIVGDLKNADALRVRHIFIPSLCRLCHNYDETATHLFFECSYSFSILTGFFHEMNNFLLRPNIFQVYEWINGKYNGNLKLQNFYKLVVSTIIYFVWIERNNRSFGNHSQCQTSLLLCIKRAIFEKIVKWRNAIEFLDRL
ncbi:hypothetical protein MA16_Dca009899 [Dendrobium catenatum]|uniref:Reverse transcriptase zinc-binding domain-containing protein n=1 Tax=Dendrobium catenatum TaxID=906689 RepID=A0A2I0VKI6_9ASPA|nr:hypothetical protein MA16_Dca009899 [Dendrobium catenatum]